MKKTTRTSMHLGLAAAMLPIGVSAQDATKAGTAPKTAPPKSPWTVSASAALKETFDSNVYLQSNEPRNAPPPGVTWAQADQSSMVTSLIPSVGVSYKASDAFSASLTYAPEFTSYHADSSEDYVAQKGALKAGGKSGSTSWDLSGTMAWIDGDDLGLFFDPAFGGAPAAGGPQIRDRRDAWMTRENLKVVYASDKWMFRPLATFYYHDFRTEQHSGPVGSPWYGYQNYCDRWEATVGFDVGYKVVENTYLTAGYRFGHQDQGQLLTLPTQYDSYLHRPVVGVDGKPWEWLTISAVFGPDFRSWDEDKVPASFQTDELQWYWDGTATISASKQDSIVLMARRFMQPGFGGASVYNDITYNASWKHKFDARFSSSLGFQAYSTDFEGPVSREDWVFTPSAALSCAITKQLLAELSYSFDKAISQLPNTPGREYDRHLVALGARYVFK